MKLQKVRITKYKCINDSNEFEIEEKATCLVGKNESGKTALFHVLSKLNSYDTNFAQYSDLECPRTLMTEFENYADKHPLWTHWELEADDINALVQVIGPCADNMKGIVVCKNYRNQVRVEFDQPLVETQIVQSFLKAIPLRLFSNFS